MRADFVSQGMNHAEGGWPKVNIKSHGCIIDELRLIWVYTLYATFATFFYIWLILENPGPKTSKQEVRSYHLRITINIINIIIYKYHISISISISGYQSQWERSDYALPEENWKGREVSGSICFSSNFDHVCCLDSILVLIIIEGAIQYFNI